MRRRPGFTLIELVVTIVLLGLVGLGASRLLMSQMRFYAAATGQRDARGVSRQALTILRDELRMIEPRGIVSATTTTLQVRVPYAVGVYCTGNVALFPPVDSLRFASAVFRGYAVRDTAVNAAYQYVASTSTPVAGTASTCTAPPVAITRPDTSWRVLALPGSALSLSAGAPVLLFQTITYAFAASTLVPGRTALWRRVAGGAEEEVAVPFANTAAFRFFVSGGATSQGTPPQEVDRLTGVELVLVGESERSSAIRGTPESAPVRLAVFFRNVPE